MGGNLDDARHDREQEEPSIHGSWDVHHSWGEPVEGRGNVSPTLENPVQGAQGLLLKLADTLSG